MSTAHTATGSARPDLPSLLNMQLLNVHIVDIGSIVPVLVTIGLTKNFPRKFIRISVGTDFMLKLIFIDLDGSMVLVSELKVSILYAVVIRLSVNKASMDINGCTFTSTAVTLVFLTN